MIYNKNPNIDMMNSYLLKSVGTTRDLIIEAVGADYTPDVENLITLLTNYIVYSGISVDVFQLESFEDINEVVDHAKMYFMAGMYIANEDEHSRVCEERVIDVTFEAFRKMAKVSLAASPFEPGF